ncbi:MAG: hypothetical protein ACRDOZ_07180, partial [Nocardioides sp.]
RTDVVDRHLGRVALFIGVGRKSEGAARHMGSDSLGGQMSCGRALKPFSLPMDTSAGAPD